jgi:hypothetical protein
VLAVLARMQHRLSGKCENRAMGFVRFSATLVERGPAAAIVLDAEQVAAVGEGARRFPVAATVNGYTWRTTVAHMGGEFLVGLSRAVREGAGVQAGDMVEVELELDDAPREVDVPEALASALAAQPSLRTIYDSLAYTYRKEYARSVREAKRKETRERRVAEVIEKLRERAPRG